MNDTANTIIKDRPVDWEMISQTTNDFILSQEEDDMQRFFYTLLRYKIQLRDPDATRENLSHLFEVTQYALEFVVTVVLYFYCTLFFLELKRSYMKHLKMIMKFVFLVLH